jgi:uncharacterized protein YkwD
MGIIAAMAAAIGIAEAGTARAQTAPPDPGWHRFGEHNPPAGEPSAKTSGALAALEKEMYELINRDRAENHGPDGQPLPPLRWSDELAAVARAHSRDMVARGYFGHVDPDGHSPGMRVKAAGLEWQAVGENIAMDSGVRTAESGFMNEPRNARNHRSNVLSPKFTEVGVGIVAGRGGQLFITQEFMNPAAGLRTAFDSPQK